MRSLTMKNSSNITTSSSVGSGITSSPSSHASPSVKQCMDNIFRMHSFGRTHLGPHPLSEFSPDDELMVCSSTHGTSNTVGAPAFFYRGRAFVFHHTLYQNSQIQQRRYESRGVVCCKERMRGNIHAQQALLYIEVAKNDLMNLIMPHTRTVNNKSQKAA
jgi:hypothetical protein